MNRVRVSCVLGLGMLIGFDVFQKAKEGMILAACCNLPRRLNMGQDVIAALTEFMRRKDAISPHAHTLLMMIYNTESNLYAQRANEEESDGAALPVTG